MASWDGAHDPAVAMLLTDELVTNAVVHTGTDIVLVVRFEPPVFTVEVHDHSEGRPELVDRGLDAEGGRGVRLVDRLADRWGTRTLDGAASRSGSTSHQEESCDDDTPNL